MFSTKFVFCAALAGLACSAAAAGPAQKGRASPDARVQRISPVSMIYQGHTYPVLPGGSDDAVVVFENGSTQTTGLFGTTSLPRAHVMDEASFTPGPGAGAAVLITSMVVPLGSAAIVTLPNQ